MGRRIITVCSDDLTGEEVPEEQVQDVKLMFAYDEWTLTLTEASREKVRELFAELVANAPHKDLTPKWLQVQRANEAAAAGSQPDTEQPTAQPTVTVVPPDNKTVRRWWRDIPAAQLKSLGLKVPPATDRGKIPDDVMAAFVESHKAPAAAFSG